MASPNPNPKISASDKELGRQPIRVANAMVLPMMFKLAIELNILRILSRAASDAFLPPSRITEEIKVADNLDMQVFLDRLLNLLASHSILKYRFKTREDGTMESKHRMSPIFEFLTEDADGGSVAPPLLLHHDKVILKSRYHLHDAIMEAGVSNYGAHGKSFLSAHGKSNEFWSS